MGSLKLSPSLGEVHQSPPPAPELLPLPAVPEGVPGLLPLPPAPPQAAPHGRTSGTPQCTLLKGVQQDTFVWETSHF